MTYQAEIFDMVQYLFETTGFNDHQLHGVIRYKNKVDSGVMEKAARMLLDVVPILKCGYCYKAGRSYWQEMERIGEELFTIVTTGADFERFTFSKTDATRGPQIRFCLYRGEKDCLSIIVNHMVTDGAGMKELCYLLASLYSAVLQDETYQPDFVVDGDRDYDRTLYHLNLRDRLRVLLFHNRENNETGTLQFPFSDGDEIAPFIMTHELTTQTFRRIVILSKEKGVTVNDVLLTAYIRALSTQMKCHGETLCVPMMIDMRRYLEDKSFKMLTNLASMETLRLSVKPEETFEDTLGRVAAIITAKKDNYFGLNSFVKLQTLFKHCGRKRAYRLLEAHLKNPNICMTNIGVIDAERLVFEGSDIDNVILTGSIKYRPHFQMSLTTFRDQMTLAVNLYGNNDDRLAITDFLEEIEHELAVVLSDNGKII